MNQVRFNLGVPKVGSAAAIAEDSAGASVGSIRPRAGSSARDAEQRKRAEPFAKQRVAAVGMRAQGGRVVTPEEMHASSAGLSAESQKVAEKQGAVAEGFAGAMNGASKSSANHSASVSFTGVPEQVVEENASSHPLQTAAVRIKSLVQSLFSPGASSSKS